MVPHSMVSSRDLLRMIRRQSLRFAGNSRLKIFGTLQCGSGKRMKRCNRVFFTGAAEAFSMGYRPCAHCLRNEYREWQASRGIRR